jgi:hypothetical protein
LPLPLILAFVGLAGLDEWKEGRTDWSERVKGGKERDLMFASFLLLAAHRHFGSSLAHACAQGTKIWTGLTIP